MIFYEIIWISTLGQNRSESWSKIGLLESQPFAMPQPYMAPRIPPRKMMENPRTRRSCLQMFQNHIILVFSVSTCFKNLISYYWSD